MCTVILQISTMRTCVGNTILDDTYCTEGLFENLDKNAKKLSRKRHSWKLLKSKIKIQKWIENSNSG